MKLRIITTPRYDNDLAAHFARIVQDKPEPAYRLLKVAAESIERFGRDAANRNEMGIAITALARDSLLFDARPVSELLNLLPAIRRSHRVSCSPPRRPQPPIRLERLT